MTANQAAPPTLILSGGKVITLDATDRICSAVAIENERIVAVGDDASMLALKNRDTVLVDLAGRAVVPGLIDGHAHMDREGLKAELPSLSGVRSVGDVLDAIAREVRKKPPGEWIVMMPLGEPPEFAGMPQLLKEGRWPDRYDIDRVAPNNPVYIRSIWGYWRHTLPLVSIANSRALELCGIGRDTPAPSPNIEIVRDGDGKPTGVFIEQHFMPMVEFTLLAAAPGFTVEQRTRGLQRSMEVYNKFGTTSIFEGHGVAADVLAAYEALRRAGRQTVRAGLVFSPAWSLLAPDTDRRALLKSWLKWLGGRGYGDEWVRLFGLYAEIEDSPDHRVRARALPQTGWAGFNYDCGLPREALLELLIEAARNSIRVVGIWPNMLDLFSEVDRVVPISNLRWIYGHLSLLTDERVKLVRDLGLVVTTHTNRYIWKEGALLKDRIGDDRQNEIVPLRKLLDAGVKVSLATDNVPPSMFHPIWHAVDRVERSRGEVIAPDQRLTRMEALRCASINGAYLSHDEKEKGSIEVGKLADLVVLSQDPLTVESKEIAATVAELTIIGGQTV